MNVRDIKLRTVDHHRNGVGGNGFYVGTFDWKDDGGRERHMLAVTFDDDPMSTAVVDIDLAQQDKLDTFEDGNAWRGDRFATAVRQVFSEAQDAKFEARMKSLRDGKEKQDA